VAGGQLGLSVWEFAKVALYMILVEPGGNQFHSSQRLVEGYRNRFVEVNVFELEIIGHYAQIEVLVSQVHRPEGHPEWPHVLISCRNR
jgi:hypothetical protein